MNHGFNKLTNLIIATPASKDSSLQKNSL